LKTATGADKATLEGLRGKVAIANAKLAHQSYKKILPGRGGGAREEGRAGPTCPLGEHRHQEPQLQRRHVCRGTDRTHTVNTVPPDTLAAFRDHGKLRPSLEEDIPGAVGVLNTLEQVGISLTKATDELIVDAVKKFVDPHLKLLDAVERRRREVSARA
jgi:transaldolase